MIRIRQIKIDVKNDSSNELEKQIKKILKINNIILYEINKKSIDARKENIYYVYEVDVKVEDENNLLKRIKNVNVLKTPDEKFNFEISGTKKLKNDIVVVGLGPAGLFSSYILLENGYKVTIIERGKKVEDRVKDVEEFFETGVLNENSNVQFGEGGAGTFSDGKLNTLVKDKEFFMKKVFEVFVENGAPKEIMYENKPHIGTDVLRQVVINMRNKIINMGGKIRYNSTLTDINIEDGKITSITINEDEKIKCESLILAIGHSARDTFKMLNKNNIDMTSKPFAVGIRIQHNQELINKNQYKSYYKIMKPASYKLTYKSKDNRGVYSFCMCPGGFVVNSSSEKGRLVINGMSNYDRSEENANSALVVTIDENDYGNDLFDGVKFQQSLEEKAYKIGNGKIPIQLLGDFENNKESEEFKTIRPIFKGQYKFSNINEILPKYICNDLIEAIKYFDTKIKGYYCKDSIIAAVETRTSSPIRINRNNEFMTNIYGIFPCGEGSGYSGGITTSAMDGIRVAKQIGRIYTNE